MNLFADFEQRIRAAVAAAIEPARRRGRRRTLLDRITAEPPRDPAHGDVATNAAMVLAKPLGMKPRELALRIAARLEADPDVASVEVAGPGFVNLRLADAFWAAQLARDPARRHGATGTPMSARGEQGERRIRLGQSDRADACRPLPRRRGRRRDRQPAGGDRPCGDARILHQRCRRAGRSRSPAPPSCATARRSARRSARSRAASIPATT